MSILVTRPSPAGEELVSRLRTLGQVAWHFPLIEFSPGRQLPQLFRHWTHHRAGTTYRKRTEDSLPAGSGNQRSLATIT